MGKLHELLAVEETVVQASEKLLGEVAAKFNRYSEFFTGSIRTLNRLNSTPEDAAIERSERKEKQLPTNVNDTLAYVMPFLTKALNTKLHKHLTNQVAKADLELNGKVIMRDVPVDFLLDLEKQLPKLRTLFSQMPTLDPSRKWNSERDGVYKSDPVASSQTAKIVYPVVLAEATEKHPAQVKESSKDIVVGVFSDVTFSGAATSQQKADVLKLLDDLIAAAKTARMRANSVDIVTPQDGAGLIVGLIEDVFQK